MTEKEVWDLTWEDWVKIGEAMKKLSGYLLNKHVNTKPKTGAKARRLEQIYNRLVKLRCSLDDLVCEAFPNKEDAIHVFYGRHPNEE